MSQTVALLLLCFGSVSAIQAPLGDANHSEPEGCMQPILSKAEQTPLKLLLLGNGFSGPIAVELERQAKEIGLWSSVTIDSKTSADSFIKDHFDHIASGAVDPTGYDAVILQEQSQVPGFWSIGRGDGDIAQPLWERSVSSVKAIAKLLKDKNVPLALLQTWGYRNGDLAMGSKAPLNGQLFSSYTEMQNRVTKGYRILEAVAQDDATNGRVYVVPVGEVMRRVQGSDAADFPALYVANGAHDSGIDGKYLSADGNFLAAATLLRSLTGRRPRLGASSELRARLLDALPDGPGPCDGNPQFSSIANDYSGAKTTAISSLLALSVAMASGFFA